MREANRKNHEEEIDDSVAQYLTFMLGGKVYGLEILNVREIISYGDVTELPMMPAFIGGVINLRGTVVPIIDLAQRFTGKSIKVSKRTSIIILDVECDGVTIQLGIIVDTVQEVLDIRNDEIESSLSLGSKIESAFINGMAKIDDKLLVLLNIENLLSVEELSLASSMPENLNAV
jgi:purine-binding chemotaxis protein CheW